MSRRTAEYKAIFGNSVIASERTFEEVVDKAKRKMIKIRMRGNVYIYEHIETIQI